MKEGIQQGDPLGPLLFCLCVHPLLESIIAPLCIGYMDDLTLGGPAPMVSQAVFFYKHIFGLHTAHQVPQDAFHSHR